MTSTSDPDSLYDEVGIKKLQEINEKFASLKDEELKEFLQKIELSSTRIVALVNDKWIFLSTIKAEEIGLSLPKKPMIKIIAEHPLVKGQWFDVEKEIK